MEYFVSPADYDRMLQFCAASIRYLSIMLRIEKSKEQSEEESKKEARAHFYRSQTNVYQELELKSCTQDFIDYVRDEEVLPFSILQLKEVNSSSPQLIIDLIKVLCGRGMRALKTPLEEGLVSLCHGICPDSIPLDYPIILSGVTPAVQYSIFKLAQKNALQRLKERLKESEEVCLSVYDHKENKEKKDSSFSDEVATLAFGYQIEAVLEETEEEEHKPVEQIQQEHKTSGLPALEIYQGSKEGLLDFKKFLEERKESKPSDREESFYPLLRQEFFANRPRALKFISPEASDPLANEPAYATLNAPDSLPYPFVAQVVPDTGEWVLHYDETRLEEEHESTLFTPHPSLREREEPLVVDYDFEKEYENRERTAMWSAVGHCANGDIKLRFKERCCERRVAPEKLINLYVRFSVDGVELLGEKLDDLTSSGMGSFLWDHYLSYFDHLDIFFLDLRFFQALKKIKKYTYDQITCLKKFMEHTGSSKQALSNILLGFDAFWQEITLSCQKNNAHISDINANWSTRKFHRLVVMKAMDEHHQDLYYPGFPRTLETVSKIFDNAPVLIAEELFPTINFNLYVDKKGMGQWEKIPICSSDLPSEIHALYSDETNFRGDELFLFDDMFLSIDENDREPRARPLTPLLRQFIQERHLITSGGSAVVYMGRLLEILRKDFKKQLACLDGLSLENYGPYYASLTGYNVVSRHMRLCYDPDEENKKKFSVTPSYHVDFDVLYRSIHSTTSVQKKFRYLLIHAMACRFLGVQSYGMDIPSFTEKMPFKILYPARRDWSMVGMCQSSTLLSLNHAFLLLLFFVSHDRYQKPLQKSDDFYNLVRDMLNDSHYADFNNLFTQLRALYEVGIQFSIEEGTLIYNKNIGGASSKENQTYLAKLFSLLKENKSSTLQAIKSRWSFKKIVDTAEYLQENIPKEHHADILIFSGLLFYEDTSNQQRKMLAYYKQILEPQESDLTFKEDDEAPLKEATPAERDLVLSLGEIKKFIPLFTQYPRNESCAHAFKLIVQSRRPISYAACLNVFRKVAAFRRPEYQKVEESLQENNPIRIDEISSFEIKSEGDPSQQEQKVKESPSFPQLKLELTRYIIALERLKKETEFKDLDAALVVVAQEINKLLPIDSPDEFLKELQKYKHHYEVKSGALSLSSNKLGSHFLKILTTMTEYAIAVDFSKIDPVLLEKIKLLLPKHFDIPEFYHMEKTIQQFRQLAFLFSSLKEQNEIMSRLINEFNYSMHDNLPVLMRLLVLLGHLYSQTDPKNVVAIFDVLFNDKQKLNRLLGLAEQFYRSNFSAKEIKIFLEFCTTNINENILSSLTTNLTSLHDKDHADEVLAFIIDHLTVFSLNTLNAITCFALDSKSHKNSIRVLLQSVKEKNELVEFIAQLLQLKTGPACTIEEKPREQSIVILEILAKCNAVTSKEDRPSIQYVALVSLIKELRPTDLAKLHACCQTSAPSLVCLRDTLQREKSSYLKNTTYDFDALLTIFEKAPFGTRDFEKDFSEAEVERIVNNMRDLNKDTVFSWEYRKQLIETFRFVNAAGYRLPIYHGKPAKDLLNTEIADILLSLKQNTHTNNTFSHSLYALPLLREAMYRSTRQFSYPNQMLSVINSLMYQKNGCDRVLENIDTGQGKSLIDAMKASVLFLQSPGVDITTSSLVDAKRDCEIYSSYFKLLGIPFLSHPLSSISPFSDFQQKGVQITTAPDIELLYMRAEMKGHSLYDKNNPRATVSNESDFTNANSAIFRLSVTSKINLVGNEWVYDSINEYVATLIQYPDQQHLPKLRCYLRQKAKLVGKSPTWITKIETNPEGNPLLTWMQSSYLLHKRIREKEEYVVSPPKQKKVNGAYREVRDVTILGKDRKRKPNVRYGNGLQHLTCAALNKKYNTDYFVAGRETRSVISSYIGSFIQRYRVIWGGSATVGSLLSIKKQYEKYRFMFTTIPPYQKNIVRIEEPIVCNDEKTHFEEIFKAIKEFQRNKPKMPLLVFFKDIKTAEHFHREHQTKLSSCQLYTDEGTEEESVVIKRAAEAGKVTITTPALGRNTNILYNRKIGMNGIITFISSVTDERQEAGRMGREGSPSTVKYIVNKEDWGPRPANQTNKEIIDTIRREIDEANTRKLECNETLFDVIGFFRHRIEQLPDKAFFSSKELFYRNHWAVFSKQLEEKYLAGLKQSPPLDKFQFQDRAYADFTHFIKSTSTKDGIYQEFHSRLLENLQNECARSVNSSHLEEKTYKPYERPVFLSDCTVTPEIMAAQIIVQLKNQAEVKSDDAEEKKTTDNALETKTHLRAFFEDLKQRGFSSQKKESLAGLNAFSRNQAATQKTHQAFLAEYLTDETQKVERSLNSWLSFQSHLYTLSSDINYLLLFHVLASGMNSDDAVLIVKPAIQALLNEYRTNSFFINSTRKSHAFELINKLQEQKTMKELMAVLVQYKIETTQQDIAENKNSCWRMFKPLHLTGNSRFQNCLDNSIALLMAFGEPCNYDALRTELSEDKEVVEEIKTIDGLKKNTHRFSEKVDTQNAKVISKSLTKVLSLESSMTPCHPASPTLSSF